MATASIGYTNKDYDSIRQELIARIPSLTDKWTDLSPTDLGIVLLELFCGVADMLNYGIDSEAANSFLATARRRGSVIALCQLIGYRLDQPIAATSTVRFLLPSTRSAALTIPAGTQLRGTFNAKTIDFETVLDGLILAGQLSDDIPVRQGYRVSETFTAAGGVAQTCVLHNTSIAQGTVRVKVDGTEWTEVPHFADSVSTDKHFSTITDEADVTTVYFGDGVNGAMPATGLSIVVEPLITEGVAGNCPINIITTILTPIYVDGQVVQMQVRNTVPATGGAAQETIEHAKMHAPAELKSLWRADTLGSYQALAAGYPGVAKAAAFDREYCTNVPYYHVKVVIAPNGGGLPSSGLKSDLLTYLEQRKVSGIEVRVHDPVYKTVPIVGEIFYYAHENAGVIQSRVEAALQNLFAFDTMVFGQTIHQSQITTVLSNVIGVSHVRIITPVTDITSKPNELITLGSLELLQYRSVG